MPMRRARSASCRSVSVPRSVPRIRRTEVGPFESAASCRSVDFLPPDGPVSRTPLTDLEIDTATRDRRSAAAVSPAQVVRPAPVVGQVFTVRIGI
jgi:hypothetical protein